jgi:hypothetical protein
MQLAVLAALAGTAEPNASRASLLFDNVSAYEAGTLGAAVTDTTSTPNTFMGDGYVLATGASDITGVDLYPVNLTSSNYRGLLLAVYIWGEVNTGTVSASSPAFGDLLGTYSLQSAGTYLKGKYYPFEGSPPGSSPGVTFSSPVQLDGVSTIGITFEYEGTTNGTNYNTANNLTSLISYGAPATVGSNVFNGYYRNANSETNGNFTSTLRTLNNSDQSVAVRIFGNISSGPDQWNSVAGGSWASATNWSTSVVPTDANDVIFNLSAPNYTVTVPAAGVCEDLYVQSDNITLDLSASIASLNIGGALTVGQPASPAASTNGVLNLTHSIGGNAANVSAASLAIGGNGGTGQLTIGSEVSLSIAGPASVGAGSLLAIAPGGNINVSNFTIAGTTDAWTGLVDIGTGQLDLPTASLTVVTNQVKQGYNAAGTGVWNGSGGITSSAAANDSSHLTAVGVILNNDGDGNPLYGAGGLLGTFGNDNPGANDVLARYTYFGDANLDGKVDGSDYARIDNGVLNGLTGWYNGDFNYDGIIDGSDYTLVDNAFNTQGAAIESDVALQTTEIAQLLVDTSLPEPSTLGLVCMVVIGLVGRRERKTFRSKDAVCDG